MEFYKEEKCILYVLRYVAFDRMASVNIFELAPYFAKDVSQFHKLYSLVC